MALGCAQPKFPSFPSFGYAAKGSAGLKIIIFTQKARKFTEYFCYSHKKSAKRFAERQKVRTFEAPN